MRVFICFCNIWMFFWRMRFHENNQNAIKYMHDLKYKIFFKASCKKSMKHNKAVRQPGKVME